MSGYFSPSNCSEGLAQQPSNRGDPERCGDKPAIVGDKYEESDNTIKPGDEVSKQAVDHPVVKLHGEHVEDGFAPHPIGVGHVILHLVGYTPTSRDKSWVVPPAVPPFNRSEVLNDLKLSWVVQNDKPSAIFLPPIASDFNILAVVLKYQIWKISSRNTTS